MGHIRSGERLRSERAKEGNNSPVFLTLLLILTAQDGGQQSSIFHAQFENISDNERKAKKPRLDASTLLSTSVAFGFAFEFPLKVYQVELDLAVH